MGATASSRFCAAVRGQAAAPTRQHRNRRGSDGLVAILRRRSRPGGRSYEAVRASGRPYSKPSCQAMNAT